MRRKKQRDFGSKPIAKKDAKFLHQLYKPAVTGNIGEPARNFFDDLYEQIENESIVGKLPDGPEYDPTLFPDLAVTKGSA